jgi:UrcA family protein
MSKISMLGSVAVLLGALSASNAVLAQGSGSANEQVTVTAPYITHDTQTVVGPNNRGVYDTNTLTKEVSYSDLDLSKPSDADRFIQRINDTAKQSCAELKAKYPDPPHAPVGSDNDCVKTATDQTMIVATSLISRAQVAMAAPAAPPPAQTAVITPAPEPAPAVEAEATTVAPPPPKQDRN